MNLHFLSLLESLLECNSTVLNKLLPLWTPILHSPLFSVSIFVYLKYEQSLCFKSVLSRCHWRLLLTFMIVKATESNFFNKISTPLNSLSSTLRLFIDAETCIATSGRLSGGDAGAGACVPWCRCACWQRRRRWRRWHRQSLSCAPPPAPAACQNGTT